VLLQAWRGPGPDRLGADTNPRDLGTVVVIEILNALKVYEMSFLKPVIAGDRMEIDVTVSKFIGDFVIVETVVTVDRTQVAKGKLAFAKRA
jgi:3-hydroxymyristoyl/3-hydroxydecanoyl-(acyl carrier protein) dehydratase